MKILDLLRCYETKNIGSSTRQLRAQASIGLRESSRLWDVSPASLIAIEKVQSSPTIVTLHKILNALGINFAEFFPRSVEISEEPVFSSKTTNCMTDEHGKYVFLLPRRGDIRFEMVYETIASTECKVEWKVHEREVGGVVLSRGPVRLEIEG